MRQCFTAEDLSCLLLANLHRTALLHVGTDAHIKAVLTVPASFGSAQREAVMVRRPRMRMPPGLAIPAEGCRNREGCLWPAAALSANAAPSARPVGKASDSMLPQRSLPATSSMQPELPGSRCSA